MGMKLFVVALELPKPINKDRVLLEFLRSTEGRMGGEHYRPLFAVSKDGGFFPMDLSEDDRSYNLLAFLAEEGTDKFVATRLLAWQLVYSDLEIKEKFLREASDEQLNRAIIENESIILDRDHRSDIMLGMHIETYAYYLGTWRPRRPFSSQANTYNDNYSALDSTNSGANKANVYIVVEIHR